MNPQGQGLVRAVQGPIILITVGVLFTIQRVSGVGFGKTWPVLLIVVGLLKLLAGRRPPRSTETTVGARLQVLLVSLSSA